MTTADVKIQMERIARFNRLAERSKEIQAALAAMEEPKVQGSGPFTGNTRESRRVETMRLYFSETRGGSPEIEIDLKRVHIPASSFGMWLEAALKNQLQEVQNEMVNL